MEIIRDGFTSWVKAEFETVLERHTADIRKVHAEFREASARDTSHFIKSITSTTKCPTVHLHRKRISIYTWNPGRRRGKEGAIEKQNCRKIAPHCLAGGGGIF